MCFLAVLSLAPWYKRGAGGAALVERHWWSGAGPPQSPVGGLEPTDGDSAGGDNSDLESVKVVSPSEMKLRMS